MLTDRVAHHLRATWSSERTERHGFALLCNPLEQTSGERLVQARRTLVARHVLTTLHDAGTSVVVMKGIEVAALYPDLLLRPSRDLDVLAPDPRATWDLLRSSGFTPSPTRRLDIDHHHLPPLADPTGTLGIEVHLRPNVPGWASAITAELIRETAEPSRTGIDGAMRPRDDLHALLLALHCWKGGFTKLRDLFDALLLAEASGTDVEATAAQLGLGRFWTWTCRLATAELLGETSRRTSAVQRLVVPTTGGIERRNRSRIVAPYLVTSPWRATAAHVREFRLGREARRPGETAS